MPTQGELGDINFLHLTAMAASEAFENEAYIRDAVNNHWKMHFVGFFNFWNKFVSKEATHAFIFCDKEENANLICVAFRGTEIFDAAHWQADLDFSTISMGCDKGRVHLGFMKALGLQDERDFAKGFPEEPPPGEGSKPLAYYGIRKSLAELLERHPKARVCMTGHSLGGALAALFPALLAFHGKKDILEKMTVITHAQPRVGDATFARFMESTMRDKYLRTVYRYDIVPRVPPTGWVLDFFEQFGTCIYYKDWYKYQEVTTGVPNRSYFDPVYYSRMYWSAWQDLMRAVFLPESFVSVVFRLTVGVLIPVVGPGIASHSTRNYLNGAEWAKKCSKEKEL